MPLSVPLLSRPLPFFALAALAFGAMCVYIGVNAMLLGALGWGATICGFGLAGILLAVGLWRARGQVVKRESDLNRRA